MRQFLSVFTLLGTLIIVAPVAQADPIVLVPEGVAAFVGESETGPLDTPTALFSYGEFVGTFGAGTAGQTHPWLAPSVAAYFLNGGQQLWVVRVADGNAATIIGLDGGTPASRTGIQALRSLDEVTVIAAPGVSLPGVHAALVDQANDLQDRIALLDPAAADLPADVQARRATVSSPDGYAAFYYPWVIGNPTGPSLTLPPSAYVAGAYAQTPSQDSPVGVLNGATGITYSLLDAEINVLTPLGINPLRNLSGIRIWGARTISPDAEYRYVAVRRMANRIYESALEGTESALGLPNDFALWSQLEADLSAFLQGLFTLGWFQGTTASQAYFVQVGLGTSMSQADVDAGRTVMLLGFAPLRPAEFLVMTVVQDRSLATGVESLSQPGLQFRPASPNPTSGRVAIQFRLESAGAVTLTVHDLRGRLVRNILQGESLAAGNHSLQWNGRDGAGKPAVAGVYFLQLTQGLRQSRQALRLQP